MGFTEAVRTVLGKYATFSGRAQRSEYWWWFLFNFIVLNACHLIDGLVVAPFLGFPVFDSAAGTPISLVMTLVFLLPNLGVGIRRLHDLDRSGWWCLIAFIPLIGIIIILYWFVQKGTEGPNRFGDDPLTGAQPAAG